MSEHNKNRCLVLLPSGPHYERLFDQILQPAIAETGLALFYLPLDPQSPIPINAVVDEIAQTDALFADLSENTPEIWLAAGCAVALGKTLCLISSRFDDSRLNARPPLSIQHLPLIPYPADAFPSDYAELQRNIFAQLSTIGSRPEPPHPQTEPYPQTETYTQTEPYTESEPYTPFLPSAAPPALSDDLASYEVMALTIISVRAADTGLSPRDLGLEMQTHASAHLTSHAMNTLKRRRFIEKKPVQISNGNELHISENLFITRAGQEWLLHHGRRATTHRSTTRTRDLSLNNR